MYQNPTFWFWFKAPQYNYPSLDGTLDLPVAEGFRQRCLKDIASVIKPFVITSENAVPFCRALPCGQCEFCC